MAATPYDPTQTKARDRVRKLTADKAAPYRYQDEEIAVELANAGFVGDPDVDSPSQPLPELDAAIALLEETVVGPAAQQTVKQGSVTFTNIEPTASSYASILAFLWGRRNQLANALLGGGVISVVSCDFPDLDPCDGYPIYGH